jgi:large subunit ribosomal protein L3
VTQVKTAETDGYDAVQLGYGAVKEQKVNKPMKGHLKASGGLFKHLREFKVDDVDAWQVGQRVGVDMFQPGDRVDVTAISKGKGFQGGVKRHGFSGGPKTHGQSDRHRAPGSIGASSTPGRVFKGLRMAGQMGNKRRTVLNLEVVDVLPERNLVLVKGGVPGAKNGIVVVRKAVKAKK